MTHMVYIPPLQLLEFTAAQKYHLMLPQLTTIRPYNSFMRRAAVAGKKLILDNGANEGYQPRNDVLVATAWNFGVDELVLPDTMGNFDETYQKAMSFVNNYKRRLPIKTRVGFVLHGQNAQDAIHNFEALSRIKSTYDAIDVWYIPRLLVTPHDRLARVKVADAILKAHRLPKPIHFLGASPSFIDEGKDIQASIPNKIRSMDTSAPFVYALKGVAMDLTEEVIARDHETYFTGAMDAGTQRLSAYNMGVMNEWIGAKAPVSEV